jgi:hypothetical protein
VRKQGCPISKDPESLKRSPHPSGPVIPKALFIFFDTRRAMSLWAEKKRLLKISEQKVLIVILISTKQVA